MRKPGDKPAPGDAYDKGLGLLSRREHSARELKTKLARKGHAWRAPNWRHEDGAVAEW